MKSIALFLLAASALAPAQPFDLVLRGGMVVDGSGNPWYRADVGVRAGKIAAVGDLGGQPAGRVIEMAGHVVIPGFVDMMGGQSLPLLLDPESAISKLAQGITTMMAGEGNSAAPQNERTLPGAARDAGYRWATLAEYTLLLKKKRIALNVVHNVGAAQVRRIVIGDEDRPPSPDELARMKELVRQAMRDGAAGLSTALIYPPGTYARTDELVELARAAAAFGGFYSTHLRNESYALLESIEESLEIGRKAGLPVHIYHLKAAGEENWPLMQKAVGRIQQARDSGFDVTADIYPYIRNGIGLGSFLHPRHYARGAAPFLRTLRDPQVRAALRREVESASDWENWYRHVGRNWDNVLVAQVGPQDDKREEGQSIAGIARLRGKDEWETFFDLVARGNVSVNPRSMNEEQKHLALRTPWVSLCTDAGPTNPRAATSAHPRAFGSFPRVLAWYVRGQRVIPFEEAIRKMTSLAANRLRLYSRGRIAPGLAADLVVLDPKTILDRADFSRPLEPPEGIPYVIVNGQVACERGKLTSARAGRVLRAGD